MINTSKPSGLDEKESVKLNTNNKSIPDELKARLIQNQAFSERFNTDISLFESIKKNAV